MYRLMNWMLLSCKKVTELIEKESLFQLSAKERMRLKLHASMCAGCKNYQKQSQFIDAIIKQLMITDLGISTIKKEDEALKNRIINTLSAK